MQKVSVVTVTFNCADSFARTAESVLSQDYPLMEYIVVDGASTDGTLDIIGLYKDRIDVLVSEKDYGVYDAMNKAISLASGNWIIFMNAGDTFASQSVVSTVFKDNQTGKKVIYGNTVYLNEDGSKTMHNTPDIAHFEKALMMYQPYCHQSVFYNIDDKKDCIYDLRFRICADYDVALRYYKKYGIDAYSYSPITVSVYKNFDGISSNARKCQRDGIMVSFKNRIPLFYQAKKWLHYILNR